MMPSHEQLSVLLGVMLDVEQAVEVERACEWHY